MARRLDPAIYDSPHFVYKCWDADGGLVYVGCTHDLAQRQRAHYSASSASWVWLRDVVRITLVGPFVGQNARRRAMAAERHLIETEHPRANTTYRDSGLKAWETRKQWMGWMHDSGRWCRQKRCRLCEQRGVVGQPPRREDYDRDRRAA